MCPPQASDYEITTSRIKILGAFRPVGFPLLGGRWELEVWESPHTWEITQLKHRGLHKLVPRGGCIKEKLINVNPKHLEEHADASPLLKELRAEGQR